MSDKYRLLDKGIGSDITSRPRSSDAHAKIYVSKEGQPTGLETAMQAGENDRRRQVAEVVKTLFCRRTAATPAALACDSLLTDALFRWLVLSCRTPDSWSTYAARMWRWVATSDRRSLTAQADAGPTAVTDFLFVLEAADLSPRSIVSHRDVLRSWYGWLFDRDLVRRNPINKAVVRAFRIDHERVEKADGSRQALTLPEANAIAAWALGTATSEQGLAVLLQTSAGLRSEEVAALERRHLTQSVIEGVSVTTLNVPGKGKKTRKITLETVVEIAWCRYVKERRRQGTRGPLLVAPGGGHYNRRTIQRWAKMAAAVVGRALDISSQDLRRSALTLLIENGGTLKDAKDQGGHANLETTVRSYVIRNRVRTARTGITAPADEVK